MKKICDKQSAAFAAGIDAVVPVSRRGLEPLHALCSKSCLPMIRERVEKGGLKIAGCFNSLRAREVPVTEMERFCDLDTVLLNVNTEEYLTGAERLLAARR